MQLERIDKILASQNVGSRKEVQALIRKGVIKVNGEVIRKKDVKINPEKDEIKIMDEVLKFIKYM